MKAKLRGVLFVRACVHGIINGVNGSNEELSVKKYFCLPFDSMVIVSHAFILQSKLIFKAMNGIE